MQHRLSRCQQNAVSAVSSESLPCFALGSVAEIGAQRLHFILCLIAQVAKAERKGKQVRDPQAEETLKGRLG